MVRKKIQSITSTLALLITPILFASCGTGALSDPPHPPFNSELKVAPSELEYSVITKSSGAPTSNAGKFQLASNAGTRSYVLQYDAVLDTPNALDTLNIQGTLTKVSYLLYPEAAAIELTLELPLHNLQKTVNLRKVFVASQEFIYAGDEIVGLRGASDVTPFFDSIADNICGNLGYYQSILTAKLAFHFQYSNTRFDLAFLQKTTFQSIQDQQSHIVDNSIPLDPEELCADRDFVTGNGLVNQ